MDDVPILKGLNNAQRLAVTSKADTLAILAGPGSGKTHTLTARVVWLVEQVGYQAQDVIVATFTTKAAKEMKERITKALGEEQAKRIVLGTFHSIARRYIATYGQRIGIPKKFAIADDSDARAIIKRICEREKLKVEPPAAKEWISNRKVRSPDHGTVLPPQPSGSQQKSYSNEDMLKLYTEYQDHLERSDLLDYDDLLVKGVELLSRFPLCVSNVQAVLIDEYQDTNHIQYELMKLFATARQRITIVGDPDQSIYGWRSADIRNFANLFRDYPDNARIALEENYRSSGSILESSLNVIQQDKERIEKVLTPTHQHGTRPVLRKLKTNNSEGEWIVQEIQRITTLSGKMLKGEDCAILFRSAYLSRQVESALGRAGVAYRMIGGLKFYERLEIKIVLDYLRVIYQPDNTDALVRIINTPKRGVGVTTIKNLVEEAEREKLSLWNILFLKFRGNRRELKTRLIKPAPHMISTNLIRIICSLRHRIDRADRDSDRAPFTLVDLIEELVKELDLINYIKQAYPQEHEGRLANIQELMNLVGDFVQENNLEENLPQIDGMEQTQEVGPLGKFLTNVALATDAQTEEAGDVSSVVTLSTIHAAKGLEWPVVFIPAVYNGSIPHSRSDNDDEERRLLYVAMTRAKALLYLSHPLYKGQYGGDDLSSQSPEESKLSLSRFIPQEIERKFRNKGPVFEQKMVNEIAKILGRDAPSLNKVFNELPTEIPFNINDEFYPVDPNESKRCPGGSQEHMERPQKRQKMYSSQNPFANQGNDIPWRKEYSTTMEQSSSFTVTSASLPGFTTAGAHCTAMATAAVAAPARGGPSSRSGQGPRAAAKPQNRDSNQRPRGQMSLAGYARGQVNGIQPPRSSGTGPTENEPPQKRLLGGQVQNNFNRPLDQDSINAATRRGLQDVRRRVQARANQKQDTDDNVKALGNGYPGFSSSPPRAPSPEKKPVVTATDPENQSPPPAERPASCFHATTMTSTKVPASGGIRRPPGLNRVGLAAVAPVDKLRKPFQPLTVARVGPGPRPGPGNLGKR